MWDVVHYCFPAASAASTSASHTPSFFSMANSALLAYGSRLGPAGAVRFDGRERDRWIWFGGKRLAGQKCQWVRHDHVDSCKGVRGDGADETPVASDGDDVSSNNRSLAVRLSHEPTCGVLT